MRHRSRVFIVVVLWLMVASNVGDLLATTITYTDPTLFQAVINSQSTTTFDSFSGNTVLSNGTVINGATYTFNIAGGFSGLATNLYQAVSTPNTLGVNRSTSNPFANDFFFAGDSVTLTFAQPTQAVGAYFSSNPLAGNALGFISISTPVGTASNGLALPAGTFGFGGNVLRFVGLSSDQPFSSATLRINNPSPGNVGFVTDNITVGVPKSPQQIYHFSLNSLSGLDLTNPLSQNLGLNIMDTSLTTARTLSGPLITKDLQFKILDLIGLGNNLWKLYNIFKTGIAPLGPFQFFILPCPISELIYCLLPGQSKGFSASSNEIFDFNLTFQIPSDSLNLNLFQIGDRIVLDSPIFSDETFSIASLIGIASADTPGFSNFTFRFEGVSVLAEQQIPEPPSWLLMFLGLLGFGCIFYTKTSTHAPNQ